MSQLREYIPVGASPEDSTNLALQVIDSWATEQLFLDMATIQLSKTEKDVSKELEDYKNSLLKYRYEQRYINERLDTLVTDVEIEAYYEAHKDLFVLDVPIMKARFLDIMKDSPNLEVIKKKMSSDKVGDVEEADSLAYSSALKYMDSSDSWMNALSLAKEFGTDYGTMLSHLSGKFIEIDEDRGDVKIAFIVEMRRTGAQAPVEYCAERIRNTIISNRKHALLATLERELLDDALEKENFVIY